jgi:hypothetical protein
MKVLFAALLTLFLASPVPAAEFNPSREFQIKAVFLYNFAQFIDWPADAFESPESPLVIGVLGADPFGPFLDQTVHGEKVNGRPLVVRRFQSAGEIDLCHILFISGSEAAQAQQIVASLKGRPVLTVSDWEEPRLQTAVVRFLMERGRVRLRINLDAAKSAGLNISSKLLRSAETVSLPVPIP